MTVETKKRCARALICIFHASPTATGVFSVASSVFPSPEYILDWKRQLPGSNKRNWSNKKVVNFANYFDIFSSLTTSTLQLKMKMDTKKKLYFS